MTNTLATPGPFDPSDRTDPSEPVFLLVGRDPHAPAAVRHWVDLTRSAACAALIDAKPGAPEIERNQEKLRQCSEADIIASEMDRWRKGQPDRDEGQARAVYSGTVLDAEQLSEAQRKEKIAEAVRDLREAAFYASEARDKLLALGVLEPAEQISIEAAMASCNVVAEAYTMRRPGLQEALPLASASA